MLHLTSRNLIISAIIILTSTIGLSFCSHHHYHLKHFRANSPGKCNDDRAHHSHSHHVHLGGNGACETLQLREDMCIEILRSDCTYHFYAGDQCRGNLVSPNRGEYVGSVKVKACPPSSSGDDQGVGWRKNGRGRKSQPLPNRNSITFPSVRGRGRQHHHDKSTGSEDKENPWYWDT